MTTFLTATRAGVLALLCLVLTACNQTAVSGYDPKPSKSVTDQRKAKIEASRKRAKAATAKRKATFLAKREAAREKARSRNSAKSSSSRKKVAKKGKRKTVRKTARKSTKRANRKVAKVQRKVGKTSVSKKKRVKQKTAAFVGGRSKGITKNAPWGCVPGRLKRVLDQVSQKYGRVIVNSTNRSRSRNRMVGGKKRSYHIGCRAVDFRVAGSNKGLSRFLRNHPSVGGFKRYAAGFYHIDTGPRRTW
ncbi:D-Ala-D-Ala carboxypeptidase family metallohydrolase [Ahrensia sp. R2A130]|uniref:YcbK family protein n=1 Tax=Ahrensia sp. R2A130 TaxID=744979 RepID=UPI0001E0A47E|nr:D-Ala-D-Ala carboxypeptidase family metallohydrolase [Ahrensia sp. R2A130]EFL89672.1 putative side tail fiber protein [Ahrensia sp. R2A130]